MKNAVLLLLVYSTVVTVFLIAYFLPIKQALARVFGVMNFPQRFILLFAFFTIIFVVGAFVLLILLKVDVQTNLGQVGDFVGGLLNPILSFLALIAIVISISIQEKELKSSVHSLQSQEKIFRIQNFESSIFNLLAMQRSRRAEQILNVEKKDINAYKQITLDIHKKKKEITKVYGSGYRAHVEARKYFKPEIRGYDACALIYQQFLFIIKMIENGNLTKSQENYYISLAYSDLSVYEAVVLCNISIAHPWLRKIIKKNIYITYKDEFVLSALLWRHLRDE